MSNIQIVETYVVDPCPEKGTEVRLILDKVFNLVRTGMGDTVTAPFNKSQLIERAIECLTGMQNHDIIRNFKIDLLEEDEDTKATREVLEEYEDKVCIEATIQIPFEVSYIEMEFKLGTKI